MPTLKEMDAELKGILNPDLEYVEEAEDALSHFLSEYKTHLTHGGGDLSIQHSEQSVSDDARKLFISQGIDVIATRCATLTVVLRRREIVFHIAMSRLATLHKMPSGTQVRFMVTQNKSHKPYDTNMPAQELVSLLNEMSEEMLNRFKREAGRDSK